MLLGDVNTAAVPCHVVGIAPFPPTQPAELGFHPQFEGLNLLDCHLECRAELELKVINEGCESVAEHQEWAWDTACYLLIGLSAPIDSLHEFPKR